MYIYTHTYIYISVAILAQVILAREPISWHRAFAPPPQTRDGMWGNGWRKVGGGGRGGRAAGSAGSGRHPQSSKKVWFCKACNCHNNFWGHDTCHVCKSHWSVSFSKKAGSTPAVTTQGTKQPAKKEAPV